MTYVKRPKSELLHKCTNISKYLFIYSENNNVESRHIRWQQKPILFSTSRPAVQVIYFNTHSPSLEQYFQTDTIRVQSVRQMLAVRTPVIVQLELTLLTKNSLKSTKYTVLRKSHFYF